MSIFKGGVPTDIEVKSLTEAFPSIEVGRMITYEEVETIIGERRDSSRFRTVTNRWRTTLLRTQNVKLVTRRGEGFVRESSKERGERDFMEWTGLQRGSARRVRDMQRIDTNELGEQDLRTHDHRLRVLTAHLEHTRSTAKEIAPPSAQRSLPRAPLKVVNEKG